MGILKKIEKGIIKGEKKYEKLKKETAGIRRIGGKIFDVINSPPKKGKKRAECPPCPCTKPKKRTTGRKKR